MHRLLLCCRRRPPADMGAALSQPQEGAACGPQPAPTTMAEVIRERKKKAGGAGLATLRRRLAAAAARRPRSEQSRERGCRGGEHARYVRQLVATWKPAEVAALHEEYEAAAALRDLITQAELAREPAPTLQADLAHVYADRWCGDAELVYRGSVFTVHRAILSARCPYFRDLLNSYPSVGARICLEGMPAHLTAEDLDWVLRAIYAGDEPPPPDCCAEGEGGGWCSCPRLVACVACSKWGGGAGGGECCARAHLDILGAERTASWQRSGGGGRGGTWSRRPDAAQLRRAADEFGFRLDSLHRDMRYLLDSGDYSDASLVFSWEGGGGGGNGSGGSGSSGGGRSGSDYGFRPKLELPCHRAILAARSPFFRSVIARRERAAAAASGGGDGRRGRCGGPGGVVRVCVDERVLPRRFARALLHAAYTDQVDLSLISRSSTSPQSSAGGSAPATAWGVNGAGGGGGGGGKSSSLRQQSALDDACELYEIARFLEMPIVVQGCEDAIVEALSGETLPRILEWSRAPHASKWVHRQAMRYLRDEFASLASGSAPIQRLPRAALADALASPFLQASEVQALRALLRWGERAAQARAEEREPNVVWHTAHSVSRKGARRRDASDAELREVIAPLVPLLRLEHALPHDSDVLKEARRRGLVSQMPPQLVDGGSTADAWLGRGPYRPPRLFLPYYEEVKALLEDQMVAEAEVSRVRRARYIHHIPDTLYMVSAERAAETATSVEGSDSGAATAPAPHVVRAMRARARELRAAPPAARALRHPTADTHQIHRQIALRTVREFSLPDACAELIAEDERDSERRSADITSRARDADVVGGGWESGEEAEGAGGEAGLGAGAGRRDALLSSDDECDPHCRCPRATASRESCAEAEARSRSAGSRRSLRSLSRQAEEEWRLEVRGEAAAGGSLPAIVMEGQMPHTLPAPRYGVEEAGGAGRLSEAVPDVAVCRSRVPNANTHLLSGRDYFRRVFTPLPPELSGGMLQLDLGDGATHTPPRHGSRAHRAAPAPTYARAAPSAPVAPLPLHRHAHRDLDLQAGMSTLSLQRRERAAAAGARAHDELRAAVELSVMQAYSSFLPRSLSPSVGHPLAGAAVGAVGGGVPTPAPRHSATLPHYPHQEAGGGVRPRSPRPHRRPSPSAAARPGCSSRGHSPGSYS